MVDSAGRKQTFIVDPSYQKVYSMAEANRIANEDRQTQASHAFHYYTNQERRAADDFPFEE